MMKAAPPSDTGQQSSSFSGDATGLDAITSATRDRLVELGAGMGQRMLSHQHGELGEVLFGHAIFVHVARGDEAVIGGDGRTQRHLVVGMTDLRQRHDRGIAALAGQAVLAGDAQDVLDHASVDEVMRKHGHGKPGGAADLHGVGVSRLGCRNARRTRWRA